MPQFNRADLRNRLLLHVPDAALAGLAPQFETVHLPRGTVLCQQNEVISEVYFIEEGVASVILSVPDGRSTEAGLVGREGFGPVATVLGADRAPGRMEMQVAGRGLRIGASSLGRAVGANEAVRLVLTRYVHTFMVQLASTALFNAVAGVEQRLARWLLMCRDRLGDDDMGLTHEYLATMLSVRRASVTTALHGLEGKGLIQVQRGSIAIRDRPALEAVADASYGRAEAEYRRLFGEGA